MPDSEQSPTWDGRERRGPGRLDDEVRARRLLAKVRNNAPDAASAREALALQFQPLVQKLARQFVSGSVAFEDLVQEGFLGLMHSIDQYDPDRGVKFITYATHTIDGHLRHYLRDRVQIIKEPAWLQELALKVRREIDAMIQENGVEPSNGAVAKSLGLKESDVARIKSTRSIFSVSSLDEAQEFGGAAAHVPSEEVSFEIPVDERIVLQSALARLKEIEQKVVYGYYYEDKNQAEIAAELKVSNNYVSHILKNSARKLQQMFRSDAVREAALQHETRRRRLSALGPDAAGYDDSPSTIIDSDTGAYTRSYFDARLAEEVSRAKRHELEISIVRVAIGGAAVKVDVFSDIARMLKDCIRKSDLLARFDDREFVAMLPHTGATRIVVEERMLERLNAQSAATKAGWTVAVGSSSYPECTQALVLVEAAEPGAKVA